MDHPAQFLEDMIIDDSYFDLKGLSIRSIDLDWEPYVWISDCENDNEGCIVRGFNVDMVDLIAEQLNCTYESTKEPNDKWGNEMVDAADSMNANWSGVMGGVITGQYDMSLTAWLYQEKRSKFLSFSHVDNRGLVLVATPNVPNIDFGLFLRPFTTSAWRGIVGVLLVTYLTSFVIKSRDSDETPTYQQILAMTTWLFFVLLNSFYGGAMTMFFANDITLPFENIRDVIQAYPEWELLLLKGTESTYTNYIQQRDTDFTAFMDREVFNNLVSHLNLLLSVVICRNC